MSNIKKIIEWKFPPFDVAKKRLQEAGIGLFDDLPSRKSWKKAIQKKRVLLNGEIGKTSSWVSIGDSIEIIRKKNVKNIIKTSTEKIKVLYNDSDIVVVVKPSGIPTSGNYKVTLCSIIQNQLNNRDLHPAHRIDKNTHGLVVFYKNLKAAKWLGNAFENRTISKTYFALVEGDIMGGGFQIKTKIESKNSHSIITKIGTTNWPIHGRATFVQINPITGRKHQIRKHLKVMGHPIVGEDIYCKGERFKGQGLFLSCVKLSFVNPKTGKHIKVETALPRKFKRVLHKLDLS